MNTIRQVLRSCAAVAIVATAFASTSAAAIVSPDVTSTFDADADGWTFVDVTGATNYAHLEGGPFPAVYTATGGPSGGFISAQDPSVFSFFFSAPDKFLFDQLAMYGGKLAYDLRLDQTTSPWEGDPDVVLISHFGVLVYDVGSQPGTSFATRTVPWTEMGWKVGNLNGGPVTKAQFQQVIGSLDALMIAGEFVGSDPNVPSTFETASLDNVVLTPVPEPSAALLMALGVVGVGLLSRRRAVSGG